MFSAILRVSIVNSGPTFRNIFLVLVMVKVILGYDVIVNMCIVIAFFITLVSGFHHEPDSQLPYSQISFYEAETWYYIFM